jgi:hypothetical protein
MFRHYDRYGLVGNPAVLSLLLGRPPSYALDALAAPPATIAATPE